MKNMVVVGVLLLSLMPHANGAGFSPPGKPTLTSCRSPEKETFTCWWEPGSDGGLPTTYRLFYLKENIETVYECPDYLTAGENSCFFSKNNTSIWVNYNITVVATNELGSTMSDPVDIDVMYIVMPHPPEKVLVSVLEDKDWPFLRVSWEPPQKADTRSGWITLVYEVRIKLEEKDDWEVHLAGQQRVFNIFSLLSGGTYIVQVRCKPDHGFWSEWSSSTYVKVPNYFHRENSVWILITTFTAFIFLIVSWMIHMNRHSLKHCILPPVPGPKIKGFDKQLLKSGKSGDVFNALVASDFPPTTPPRCEDLLVEYLEVYIPEERELMREESKHLQDGFLKSEGFASDSDSGLGSCNSHTLLMDNSGEAKETDRRTDQERSRPGAEALTYAREDVSPDMSSGRVKTWPSVFSPLTPYSSGPTDQPGAKQHCLSDSVYPPGSTSPCSAQDLGLNYWEFCFSSMQPHLTQTRSDVNVSDIGPERAAARQQSPAPRPTEYVEVQRVSEEDMVLLQPVGPGPGPPARPGEDYSRVKGVRGHNVLLLQTEEEADGRACEELETKGAAHKPTACSHGGLPAPGRAAPAASGYVDTAMFVLPSC
ncbi:prolactin receptor a [Betta splendens]|uniref:Prolactin receptor n=1 Tax=Betta splendens TaxID=158456 RepID=A0A6P7P6G8_BETSP|nr:prolactin receptor a [Betta splendens]